MRFLDADEMILLLPAEPKVEGSALSRYNALLIEHGGSSPEKLKESGLLKTAQINERSTGKPVVVLWYRVEHDRLVVNTLVALEAGRTTGEAWNSIWQGLELLARSSGCDCVEGVTSRAALARVYQTKGFKPVGVVMRKALANV